MSASEAATQREFSVSSEPPRMPATHFQSVGELSAKAVGLSKKRLSSPTATDAASRRSSDKPAKSEQAQKGCVKSFKGRSGQCYELVGAGGCVGAKKADFNSVRKSFNDAPKVCKAVNILEAESKHSLMPHLLCRLRKRSP